MGLRFGKQLHSAVSGLVLGQQTSTTSLADVFGEGALAAQSSQVSGAGDRHSVDLGTPPEFVEGAATITATAVVTHVGSGDLLAGAAAVVGGGGVGELISGSGVMLAQSSQVAGEGFYGLGGSGVLLAQSAAVAGVGLNVGVIEGEGTLLAQIASLDGSGIKGSIGAGSLLSRPAFVIGSALQYDFASDYISYMPPNTVGIEQLSMKVRYDEVFASNKAVPVSVTVGWDEVVTYHDGNPEPLVTSYEFSHDKTFKDNEDEDYEDD